MTLELESAIKHCEEVAERQETNAKSLENGDDFDKSLITNCLECAREHRQLAEWLRELKKYRTIFRKIERILFENGYTMDDLDTIFGKVNSEVNTDDN